MELKRAVEILENCEKDLRKLGGEYLSSGDYPATRQVTDWAEEIKRLCGQAQSNSHAPAGPVPQTSASPVRARGRHPVDQYPKFFRKGDELVKVGWSKKEREEYHHRAPRRVVDALAQAVKHIGARGKLFTSDDILPVKDSAEGTDFPPYQAYLALAWLKELDLVKQHGRRGGYTLVANGNLDGKIASAWTELVDWRG